MNQKGLANTILIIAIVVIVAAAGWWYFSKSNTPSLSETSQLPNVPEDMNNDTASQPIVPGSDKSETNPKYYVMDISQSGDSMLIANATLGVQFSVPGIWRVGDNRLGYGTFQIFNYSDAEASYGGWRTGQNKIEMSLIDDPVSFATGEIKSVKIAGQNASRAECEEGNCILYIVPLRSIPAKFITLTIYGDSNNYKILETVVATLSIR